MIISKKKFNECIEKALMEQDKERWLRERISELERLSEQRFLDLSRRVSRLEKEFGIECEGIPF